METKQLFAMFLAGGLTLVPGCGPVDEDELDGPVGSLSQGLRGCNQCGNCVKFARCRQPRLPAGLWTMKDKRAIINSGVPAVGSVAIINSGSDGHVAYVEEVNGSKIKISEGNWGGKCGERTGTTSTLKIEGYFKP